MPGYGILEASEGEGLLPWSWFEARLTRSRSYWLATVRPDGRPHVMPVWAVWDGVLLWFSSSLDSRKVRNLRGQPHCCVTTEDPTEPVVLEGEATIETDPAAIRRYLDEMNAKYETAYGPEFLDPAVNATVRIRPRQAIGLRQEDFTGSPTRWTLG
jgi:PPOX class probable F420-dependent enzyme